MTTARIAPSILSADFVNFEADFATIASADLIHVDVMDNHFVPNLTFGLPMVARMQQITPKPLDIHLMIENSDRWAPGYAEAGAYSVTFHAETTDAPVARARRLREIGARAGIAIKPGTDIEPYLEILPEFDMLLVMTVEPGFGGQSLIEHTLEKVAKTRRRIDAEKLDVWLQVDGGIDESNIERVAALGADTFVAGSAVFKSPNRAEQIALLRDKATAGCNHLH
jgi:ribulose-phosphate 3-epimerase